MDRIIEVKVGGSYLSKDNKNAGVRGEANVTKLRITFDEGWDGFAKTVTFWDARGGNPVERTLTTDLLENIAENTRVYLVPIPAEPMAEAGKLTFVIDGYLDGKRQRSIADKLEVKDSPISEDAGDPVDPTPSQAEQLQVQIDNVLKDIQGVENMSVSAETLEADVPAFVEKTKKDGVVNLHYGLPKGVPGLSAYEIAVKQGYKGTEVEWNEAVNASRDAAEKSAEDAERYALQAKDAVGKTSYIGENGNWYAWDGDKSAFYDTGIKAQSGSTVYYGDNPPPEADVWINPDGESDICAPYIGENGNWYTFNPETQSFTDSGFRATLTAEQLANIDAVQNKEDVSNKIQSLNLATGDEAQYPSAKAVVDEIFRVDNDLNLANDRITILEKDVSDIGGALDAIIAIQTSLIGGDSV